MRLFLLICMIGASGWVVVRDVPPPGQTQKLPPTTVEERRAWLRERISEDASHRLHGNPACPGDCHGHACFIHFDATWNPAAE